jgi:dUTPase
MVENGVKRANDEVANEPSKKLKEDQAPPLQDKLLIKRTVPNAKLPTRGSAFSAGYDLYRYDQLVHYPPSQLFFSAEKKVIPARGKALVDTGISIAVPVGTYGRIAPRSGLGKPKS